MRIFLAGATGAIGRHLIPLLLEAGHDVTGTSRSDRGLDQITKAGARAERVDAFDAGSVHRAVAQAAPDVVIHQLTALSGLDFAENARMRKIGTRNLVDAAKATGVDRIVAQSICWAYRPGDAPATEDEPLDLAETGPRSSLVSGVHALESTAAELGRHVILRYGAFYGPGTFYAPDGWIADQIRAGEFPAGDALTSFIHVRDAARAAIAALDWPAGPVNIVDGEPAAAREWVPILAEALGAPAPAAAPPGRDGWERGASGAKARDELGWRPDHSWRAEFTRSPAAGPERTQSQEQ